MARTMVNRPEQTGCEFSPSVACGDSSLVRGSQEDGCFSFVGCFTILPRTARVRGIFSHKNGKGIAAQHHLRSNPF